jgi:hypothetical protein
MINTLDVNGVELSRGDYVVPSDAMRLSFPRMFSDGDLVGQVEHIFHEGTRAGIYVRTPLRQYKANHGHALRKVR